MTRLLLLLLFMVIGTYFLLLATACWTCINLQALDNGFRSIFTAIIGMVGTVAGFYYSRGGGDDS